MTSKYLVFLVLMSGVTACKKKAEPNFKNFKIQQVTLISMPFSDAHGDTWDSFNGAPDVFFNMEGSTSIVLYDGSDARKDDISKSNLPLSWSFLRAYEINNLEATHFVTIYDYDTFNSDDLIGFVGFTMNEHKVGYPKTITKKEGQVTVSITGEWY